MRRRLPTVVLSLSLAVTLAAACGRNGGGGPTEALKAYTEAASKKDAAGMKSHLSQETLKVLEAGAQGEKRNLDDLLREDRTPADISNIKFSNEKINGDSATVDMTIQGETSTMPLVKENGEWKLALDQFMRTLKRQ